MIKLIYNWAKTLFVKAIVYLISFSNTGVVSFYTDPARRQVFKLIKKIKKETELLLSNIEAYQIYMVTLRTQKVAGDIAEVGVYKGGSAKLICLAKENRPLHLFDTFMGLPATDAIDTDFHQGQFSASLAEVKNYLQEYNNVYFYPGLFPSSGASLKDKKFSFVNLDVDIYSSTLDCLKFFYPRMSKAGVIISHDYITAKGVSQAFDEYFSDKPEAIIELSGSQCIIVKI